MYNFAAKHKIFYPILFKALIKYRYLDQEFHKIIIDYASKNKNFYILQVGANDGMKFDPAYLYVKKYKWKGTLVEPVKHVFEKLKDNYRGVKNLDFENVAIGEEDGYKDFYSLKKTNENLPFWYDEIGSFDKNHLLKHKNRINDIEKRIVLDKIKVMTLKSLINKNKISKIDLLQIDAEGYDYQIIKNIPFEIIKPAMIIYEERHLSNLEKESSKNLLKKQGYSIVQGLDVLALLKKK